MRLTALLLVSLALAAVDARAAGALAVRNLSVIPAKQEVSFEIVNVSHKAVHSWTMTIASEKKQMLTTSEMCSRGSRSPLGPGESRHCGGSLYSGELDTVRSADVIVTSVLFEDGSAEGDVALLDNLGRERRSTIRYLEFWIAQLEPALAAPTAREQLQAMQKALSVPDGTLPMDLRYDTTAVRGRSDLLNQVTFSLQMLDSPQMRNPRAQAAGTVQMLQQRLNQMRTSPEPFPPRRGADLTPRARDPLQGRKVIARTNALELMAVEDAPSQMRLTTLFLRNVSQKRITAFSVTFGGPEDCCSHVAHIEDWFGSSTAGGVLPGDSQALSQASVADHTLVINAVVFEDGTSDGARRDIDLIQFTRLGRMFETERIRGIVDAADADFATLPAKLGGLPQSPEEAIKSLEQVRLPGITLDRIRSAESTSLAPFYSGVRARREETTRRLAELQGGTAALEEMRRELRDLSNRYRAYCERVYTSAQ